MAHIIITKIEASDWSEIIQGHFRAFQQEPFQQLIHGEDTPRNQQIFKERSLKQFATQSNSIWLKAIDTNNGRKIAGVVNYKLRPAYVPLSRPELKLEDMIWLKDLEDKKILDVMFRDIVDRKLRLLREGHIELDALFVLPEYRGQGIASQLIKWGCDLASHLMVPVWLEASIMAHPVYLRHGFVDIEHGHYVMGKWDVEYYVMRLEPKALEVKVKMEN
ncbi:GNAT family acetyltransferase [Histoplasma capsulatum]|uniref:GNAT family acetyltransferase n=1 Tax=Ajellomyces capsulatus TaxID=5037 RepID=A0A8A1MKV5_AJECA|nr:predicted protein [Histoplasma mississippiense (nom. inval.)]EDN05688.1 predicted protein [Histoplasma mississippiense (nom. inval.)]QSS65212.1 GNAT family acetyltransferase [Histoplasma capsulatum]